MLNVLRETEIEEPESDDMRLRDHKGITEGRIDILFCKPSELNIEEGYNVRDLTTKEARAELDELKAEIKEAGVQTPLKVRFDGDKTITIVEGHRRHLVVMELLAEFKESNGADGRKIEAVPIYAEAKGTTPLDRDFGLRHSNSGVPLKPLEFANLIYRTIHQRGISEKEAAKGFCISVTVLHNHLALREMPEPVKQHVREGNISATLAKKISKNVDPAFAKELIDKNLEENRRIKGKKNQRTKVTAKTIKRDAPKAEPNLVEVHNEVHTQTPAAVKAAEDLRAGLQAAAPTPETPKHSVVSQAEANATDWTDSRPTQEPPVVVPMHTHNLPSQAEVDAADCHDYRPTQESAAEDFLPVLIELTKQAHLCVQHNQSDEHPGWWSTDLVEAIRKARDVVERLTGKPMEFETIPDSTSQEVEHVDG